MVTPRPGGEYEYFEDVFEYRGLVSPLIARVTTVDRCLCRCPVSVHVQSRILHLAAARLVTRLCDVHDGFVTRAAELVTSDLG